MFLLNTILITFGNIEASIKKFEKSFSKQSIKEFNDKYDKDLSSKQYELESAKVYESAVKQIEVKKQKFNDVSKKMINDYSKKYNEVISKDISDEEKASLLGNLLDETRYYDEKNHQAILKLNSEYANLMKNFNGTSLNVKTIYTQMQNLHLFDKKRYLEDMMASSLPELAELYKERYLLNNYRLLHNEPIYTGKENSAFNVLKDFIAKFMQNNTKPLLGPHFERDFNGKSISLPNNELNAINKDMIKALAHFYGSIPTTHNTSDFEDYLLDYFRENYKELIDNNSNAFLYNFSNNSSNNGECDLFTIAKFFGIDTSVFGDNFGSNLVIQDDLIYERTNNGINVIYGNNKSILTTINNLYSEALYYRHLANANIVNLENALSMQNYFINYANSNNLTLDGINKISFGIKKRFVKKKTNNEASNIIDFKKQSC